MSSPQERLNKILAIHLGIGRRHADTLIESGHVMVNGELAVLGRRIDFSDSIVVDGKELSLKAPPSFVYLALHKPVGYVCSRRQQGDSPTIYSLLPKKYHHLQPVGRLDKDSSGLLLLTNDGDFALKMTHPRFHKQKQYQVVLELPLQAKHQRVISEQGVTLPDGVSKLHLEKLQNDTTWIVQMHEGRNRQIRRTFAALGYRVVTLHREIFGSYHLGGLTPGEYKLLPRPGTDKTDLSLKKG